MSGLQGGPGQEHRPAISNEGKFSQGAMSLDKGRDGPVIDQPVDMGPWLDIRVRLRYCSIKVEIQSTRQLKDKNDLLMPGYPVVLCKVKVGMVLSYIFNALDNYRGICDVGGERGTWDRVSRVWVNRGIRICQR